MLKPVLARVIIALAFLHGLAVARAAPGERASVLGARLPGADELIAAKQWMQTALLDGKARKQFSFVYDGKLALAKGFQGEAERACQTWQKQ